MARINSRTEFKSYCLRQLGFPVVRVNVSDEQVEDRVDDALDLFQEYHSDGSENALLSIQLTQEQIDNNEIQLPSDTQSVISVINASSGTDGGGNGIATINLQYQQYITDIMDPRRIMAGEGLSSYQISQSYLNLINDTFGQENRLQFNQHYDKLVIQGDRSQLQAGGQLMAEVYRRVTPEKSGDVQNNRQLKKYATALIKKQQGTNLNKFSNAQLPGGVQFNGQEIFSSAVEELTNLEEELHNNYETPPSFFVG